MKLFKCQACGNILYFENRTCGQCGHRLAYLPEQTMMSALEPAGDLWSPLARLTETLSVQQCRDGRVQLARPARNERRVVRRLPAQRRDPGSDGPVSPLGVAAD